MNDIKQLANDFRNAIEVTRNLGGFDSDLIFKRFPRGCCGDASDLLAQFLLENDIRTYYICGTYRANAVENLQSHAWLLKDNIIIDITGDQFKYNKCFFNYGKSVYVGLDDDFHRLFEVENRDIRENFGIDALGSFCQPRLKTLYSKIIKNM